ncbi:hypothetical protein Q1695_008092 [Nippostrongylus brasiliensis]|nr:hypothetical protein Q1695_008092 [Nippostrongylus brasiliensis]
MVKFSDVRMIMMAVAMVGAMAGGAAYEHWQKQQPQPDIPIQSWDKIKTLMSTLPLTESSALNHWELIWRSGFVLIYFLLFFGCCAFEATAAAMVVELD